MPASCRPTSLIALEVDQEDKNVAPSCTSGTSLAIVVSCSANAWPRKNILPVFFHSRIYDLCDRRPLIMYQEHLVLGISFS